MKSVRQRQSALPVETQDDKIVQSDYRSSISLFVGYPLASFFFSSSNPSIKKLKSSNKVEYNFSIVDICDFELWKEESRRQFKRCFDLFGPRQPVGLSCLHFGKSPPSSAGSTILIFDICCIDQ